MPIYCQVSLPLPLREAYDYLVPEGMHVAPGQRVRVPFGKRRMTGVVTAMLEKSAVKGLKPLEAVLDAEPWLSPAMLKFTRWVADYYLAAWGEVLPQAFPPLVAAKKEAWLDVADAAALEALVAGLSPRQARSRSVLRTLSASGALRQAEARAEGLSDSVLSKALALGALSRSSRVPPSPFHSGEGRGGSSPDRGGERSGSQPPPLTPSQLTATRAIRAALDAPKPSNFLLLGVTGSGKTEVYLDALEHCLSKGGGAIVLVPEIALTPQTWSRFEARFPGLVAVLHSGLAPAERARSFEALRSGKARVALGPRSALFAPVKDLRLLVVDEESEPSYKQESSPRYHARDAALVRAQMEGAVAVLGSATPSFEAYHNAVNGKLALLELPGRVNAQSMPEFKFLDTSTFDREAAGLNPDDRLLPELTQALQTALDAKEQSLLFLNRRGFAPVLACAACGEAVQCPNCSISLTYHRPSGGETRAWLRCHLCNHGARPPEACPGCKKKLMHTLGAGTQRLEDEVRRLFPRARVQRVDRDTATGHQFHADLGERMRAGELDILLGTQMLAKGLDFPGLSTVGVVNADSSLAFPDFRAAERTYQLLVQVAGRAGRSAKQGKVLVQTAQPGHPCLQAAAAQDFEAFYRSQMRERRDLAYPPFGRLAALLIRSRDKAKAMQAAAKAAEALQKARARMKPGDIDILGPAPAPLVQVKGWWRYRLLLKSPASKPLHELLETLVWTWKDTSSHLAVDVDPVSFL